MARVIIPATNEMEKQMLAKCNIHLIEKITIEEFEELLIDYLKTHNVLHLSTCLNNKPRSTTIEYWSKGLTVYMISERGGKIANIKKNPMVSYTVSDPFYPEKDFFASSGIQVWGKASMFRKKENLEKFNEIFKYSHYAQNTDHFKQQGIDVAASPFNFNVITIEPIRIRYLNPRKGFRNVTWRARD